MSKDIERATRNFKTFAELAKAIRIELNHEASREVAAAREDIDASRAALFHEPVDNDRDFYRRIRRIAEILGDEGGPGRERHG